MRDAPLSPQRTSQVDLKTLSVFSRLHRRILALSDGTRSPQKIAAILSLDLQTVHQCLRELEAEGLITYQPSSESG
ncbi:MAG: winged helix-turn-helix domain-containing protein [Ktedonobacteraceae bacterium]|nr:winged helix-turn-helix domain-containing protein [Ktedonobacteraceae bacterium]